VIDEMFEGQARSGGFGGMRDLFELARRDAMGVEKAVEDILDFLKK
jgi:hypothetical protein